MKGLARVRAVHAMVIYTGGCNGCDIELLNAVYSPRYDIEQYNVLLTWNPREADIIIVTGPVTKKTAPFLKKLYDSVPEPKIVAGFGSCAINGNVYQNLSGDLGPCDNLAGPPGEIIPVAAYVPGCPPRPEDIIALAAKAIPLLAQRKD